MESKFKIAVIGLGVIGGSLAYALKGFKNADIYGYDLNPDTMKAALKYGAVDFACKNDKEAVQNADLVIICVYPEYIPKIIENCRDEFKANTVLTDVCGVKSEIADEIKKKLPRTVDYVGGHPMAGRETDGFESADRDLFVDTGYIITPIESSKKESINLIYDMAKHIGATRITVASPRNHDAIIAYTSDLMHISASALCLTYNEEMNRAYTAGSFRDCTRIAYINPELWTELFLSNKENTLRELDRFLGNLNSFREAIACEDAEKLRELLTQVRKNKITMQNTEPPKNAVEDYLKNID